MGNIFLSSSEEQNSVRVSTNKVKVLDAKQFLDVENGGIVGSNELLASGEGMRFDDYEFLKRGIRNMKEGMKVINTSNMKLDRGGNPYKFYTFLLSARATDGVKLLMLPWIEKLMDAYKKETLAITFTLEELITEARKA